MNQNETSDQHARTRHKSHNVLAAVLTGASVLTGLATLASAPVALAETSAVYAEPTYSSPIALSQDKGFVWSVNPSADSVSVISTATDTEIAEIPVGDEPESVAVDPNNQYAYVANSAANTLSVIRINSLSPWSANVVRTYVTGAEPWNVVVSPDGKRAFVSNSAQDTITVLDATAVPPTILGNYDMNTSPCNAANPGRHFQPRGLAVTLDSTKLYVTRFLSFVKPGAGGQQMNDTGKEGLVCRLDISTSAYGGTGITGATPIALAAQPTGFNNPPPNNSPTNAYPNQMQSIVIRGDNAYLPNIAAAPAGPLRFNVSTQAFVNVIGGVNGGAQTDLGSINTHLGARLPEAGKERLFFANVWAVGFTNQSGAGNAYVVSSGSDLLVKLNVDASGALSFTNGVSTTRYIDLNANKAAEPATFGANAGKHPLGIVIKDGAKAYVMNKLSRNVSVVDLTTDSVTGVIQLTPLPAPGSKAEEVLVGAEMFFSSRGHFERPAGTTVSTDNRLSSEGWQGCSSCHFQGWTDGEVWAFASGPRKSVPLNGSFNPHNPSEQRILNYSAFFDQVEDFEINIRNISGPGPLPPPGLNGTTNNPNQGLIISDTGDINTAPFVVNAFLKSNADRPQVTVRLPGSTTSWPALTALREWVRLAVRTPNGALTASELAGYGGVSPNPDATGALVDADVAAGRTLFTQAGCATCHNGGKWTTSTKDFVSPPGAAEISTETNPTVTLPGTNPVGAQYLNRFLVNVNSFNLNVAGQGNTIAGQPEVGAVEKNQDGLDALGRDYNGDGKGIGFNTPSLLGIQHLPPYYHNGACETLACVIEDTNHRTKGLQGRPDPLTTAEARAKLVTFLRSLDAATNTLGPVYVPLATKQ